MKRKHWSAVIMLVLGAGVLFGPRTYSPNPKSIGLQDGRLRACPTSPNCVCSEANRGPDAIAPLSYSGDHDASFQSLLELLENEFGAEIVTREERYFHAVFSTPLMGFRDDVEFRLDEENSVVQMRSASRVGHSDLGANRRRVESIRQRWNL
jgi:uncharacterized protein (DUF1499 family)